MKHILPAFALATISTPALAAPPEGEGVAWDIVAGLTTEVGQRLAGSPREAAARDWAVARLKALGFANVRVVPFTITGWVRGTDRAQLTAPAPHQLAITALGLSGPTPPQGITGDLVYFATLDALRAAPEGSLKGKIAFVDHAMGRTQDGASYGPYGDVRRKGPAIAAAKGALGIVIRSAGTDSHRNPHTGVTTFPAGVAPIPAGAVSNVDANLVARIAASGKAMKIVLTLTGYGQPGLPSGHVIAELPGRDPSLPPILAACHLDSWDLGTGAIDDAAGCGIITDAALAAQKGGKTLRTIRLLWAGSEEISDVGSHAYAAAFTGQPHGLAMESDFGADRVWRVEFNFAAGSKPLADKVSAALGPMGIVRGDGKPDGGADIEAVIEAQKLPVIDLDQDGTNYFDLHHTPDDTLDKVDPAALRQNVDAWAVVLGIVANEAGVISAKE